MMAFAGPSAAGAVRAPAGTGALAALMDLSCGAWSASRLRQPASSQHADITAFTVHRRRSRPRPEQPGGGGGNSSSSERRGDAAKNFHVQLYQAVIAGDQQQPVVTVTRQPLFGATSASTTALRAKLCPALDTTRSWTRVQRKLLPKYLLLLDAVTSVHLLQCLARVQPLATQQQQQPEQLDGGAAPSLEQLSQLPTSIYATIAGPQPAGGAWPAHYATPAQLSAADAAAVADGFADAAAARREFEVMLSAVYTVLAPRLAQWPATVLVKLLCAGQLQLQHPAFLQAWLAASQPQMLSQRLSAADLFSCIEALSRLSSPPPAQWLHSWEAAMQQQHLQQLSLPQLAALQLHLLHLQLQLSDSWWQQFHEAVLLHMNAGSSSRARSSSSQRRDQEEGLLLGGADTPDVSLTAPQADALCTLLCTCHLAGHIAPGSVAAMLQLCTAACRQGHVSAAGALQLLAACCFGACPEHDAPATQAAAQEAVLALLQQRMSRLPSPVGVAVLFACLRSSPALAQHAAGRQGFVEALSLRLAELMPGLPTRLLLQMPSALAAVAAAADTGQQRQPVGDQRLAAAFALATQARLAELSRRELEGLRPGCAAIGWAMPATWEAAVSTAGR